MNIRPDETEIIGAWVYEAGKVRCDAACVRIKSLVGSHLKQIALDPESGAWRTLFVDPSDGRFWERTYPHGEMHGGGPAKLSVISRADGENRYGRTIVESPANA